MTILFEEEANLPVTFDKKEVAKQVITAVLDEEHFPYEAEVNLTLTDEESIHNINKEFRQIDRATDVLSFPLISYQDAGVFDNLENMDDIFNPDTGEAMLGDIVICVSKVLEQAKEYGHSNKREYAFLIAHSMLHLLGYDHMTEQEAAVMETKQSKILDSIGITRDKEEE